MLQSILKLAGKKKIRLGASILKVAACFVDYESEHLPPDSRIIEDSFAFSKLMGMSIGKACDVGCIARHNYISPSLAMNGWEVYGVDIRSEWQFHHPNFHFIQGDIRENTFETESLDLITCISTLEHIGLIGYYGNQHEIKEGDYEAMVQIKRVLKKSGTLLLTVPYRKTYIERPGTRVYDTNRLLPMIEGYSIKSEVVYLQDKKGFWFIKDRNIEEEGVICLELIKL
jgi:SAM-dependent methyltransferase